MCVSHGVTCDFKCDSMTANLCRALRIVLPRQEGCATVSAFWVKLKTQAESRAQATTDPTKGLQHNIKLISHSEKLFYGNCSSECTSGPHTVAGSNSSKLFYRLNIQMTWGFERLKLFARRLKFKDKHQVVQTSQTTPAKLLTVTV